MAWGRLTVSLVSGGAVRRYFLTAAFLAAGFFFGVWQPKHAEVAQISQEIKDLDMKIRKARISAKKLPEFEAKEAKVDTQFAEALKLLPNKKEIPALLTNITQLGNDSNLEFRLFSPQREKPVGFYFMLPVSVEVSGKYHDVATFFDKVGRMERIVNILDVTMKPVKARATRLVVCSCPVQSPIVNVREALAIDRRCSGIQNRNEVATFTCTRLTTH